MKIANFRSCFRVAMLALVTIPTLVLSSCNSEPAATEADKTATVVSSDTNAVSDSAAVVAPAVDTTTAVQ